jgi:hypothetical protein
VNRPDAHRLCIVREWDGGRYHRAVNGHGAPGSLETDAGLIRQSYARRQEGWPCTNENHDFSALPAVDKTGLLTDYPGLCSRKDLSA